VIAGWGGMDSRIIASEITGRCRGVPIKERKKERIIITRRKKKNE